MGESRTGNQAEMAHSFAEIVLGWAVLGTLAVISGVRHRAKMRDAEMGVERKPLSGDQLKAVSVAIAAGGVVGVLFGFANNRDYFHPSIGEWLDRDFGSAAIWAIAGASLTGAAIYCYRVYKS